MTWDKYILEIGPGADDYVIKRAKREPNALIIALDLEKVESMKYPKNVVFGIVEDSYAGMKIKDKKRGVDITISENMFDEAYINHVLLSPELENAYDGKLEKGIEHIIDNTCKVMKDSGIIIITDAFKRIFIGYYTNEIEQSLKSNGFKIWKKTEDIHSKWGKDWQATIECLYASKKPIDKKTIEKLKKY